MTAPSRAAGVRIDAHLHVWELQRGEEGRRPYPWLTPEHGELFASFTPDMASAELERAGFDAAVLVQADDTMADTEYLLTVAAEHRWVAGVVGWIPLDDTRTAAAAIDRLAGDEPSGDEPSGSRRLAGVRHLVHNDPRDDFLALPAVRESLARLAEAGLPFDVPDAWPRHLDAAVDLATAIPNLTIVIDHLGKPPRGAPDLGDWRKAFERAAALPNVVAKVSGLRVRGAPFDAAALDDVWRIALDSFGPDRLMYGGDWPMVVPDGGYAPTWRVMAELFGRLSEHDRDLLLGGTAARVYGIDTQKYCRRDTGSLE